MANMSLSLIWPGCAQGRYTVRAKGCLLAVLCWGDEKGPLAGWGPFAYVPVDPAGNGSFFFSGMRGIPRAATHVWARCVSHDFTSFETASAEIPARFLPAGPDACPWRFSTLTDLHLSKKPWKIRQALRAARSDILFLLGDSTNDGLPEQFEAFMACVEEAAPDRIVLPAIGNHDIPHPKFAEGDGCASYAGFQTHCLDRAKARGLTVYRDPDSLAWALRHGGMDIISLQCVISGRKFLFPEGRQIEWLENRMREQQDADWHLILCHAPLLQHNPNRSEGQPYLDRNRQLQALVDATGNVAFLSGHTHVSPSVIKGSAEWDAEKNNLYLNCGSVVDTATESDSGLMDGSWKDGCVTELSFSPDAVEIETRSVDTDTLFPRGYYRFQKKDRGFPRD